MAVGSVRATHLDNGDKRAISDGASYIEWKDQDISYFPSLGMIDITRILRLGGVLRSRLQQELLKYDYEKFIIPGVRIWGTCLKYEDARRVCQRFSVDTYVIDVAEGYVVP